MSSLFHVHFLNRISTKFLSSSILFLPPISKKTIKNQDGARQNNMIVIAAELFRLAQHNGALDFKSNTELLQ